MPGDQLLGEAAANFRARGETATSQQRANTESQNANQQPGENAASQLGENQRNDAQIKLQMMKSKMGETEFPPEMALQMSKDFNDPGLLHLAGTRMNNRLMTGFIAEKYKTKLKTLEGKEHKVRIGDQVHTIISRFADDGSLQFEDIGSGEAFSPSQKSGGKRGSGGSGGSREDPKDREFMKTYRQNLKDTEGMNYMLLDQMAKKDPKQAGDMKQKLDFIEKNKERFSKLQGVSEKTGAGDDKGSSLPPQAVKALKDANGQPVTFGNGQTWQIKDGKTVKING